MKPNTTTQKRRIFNLLYDCPTGMTRMQVSLHLDIERASVCRRVAELRDAGVLYVLRKGNCPITGERAEFLTTNKKLVDRA